MSSKDAVAAAQTVSAESSEPAAKSDANLPVGLGQQRRRRTTGKIAVQERGTPRYMVVTKWLSLLVVVLFSLAASWVLFNARAENFSALKDVEQFARIQAIQTDMLAAETLAAASNATTGSSSIRSTELRNKLVGAHAKIMEADRAQPVDRQLLTAANEGVVAATLTLQAAFATPQGAGTTLEEAHQIISTQVLPPLNEFSARSRDRAAHSPSNMVLWVISASGVVAAAVLIAVSIGVARRTHRVLNVGLFLAVVVVGTVAVLASVLGVRTDRALNSSQHGDIRTYDSLVQARVGLYEARAAEVVGVMAKSSTLEDAWTQAMKKVTQLTSTVSGSESAAAVTNYERAHQLVRTAAAANDWVGAAAAATDSGAGRSAARFQEADQALSTMSDAVAKPALNDLRQRSERLYYLAIGTLLGGAVAIVLIWFGMGRRLKEYR